MTAKASSFQNYPSLNVLDLTSITKYRLVEDYS